MTSELKGARRSIRPHLITGLALVLVLAGGFGGWASTVPISGALIAPGAVVVDSNVKKVQHPTGGVVGEVRVRDGDTVKAGDIVVRLDGAALDQWSSDVLGRHVGYLPQDVELFGGSVAQNISRFDPDAKSEAIIAAAKEAGVHDMIIKMREGYDTQIGEKGTALSAGQAQRVALARALYGDPFLIVLDEPNSNLDTEGDEALTRAIRSARERGAIVVVVAHRPIGVEAVDQILVLGDGRMQAFGPKEQVLARVLPRVPPTPIKIVSEGGVAKP